MKKMKDCEQVERELHEQFPYLEEKDWLTVEEFAPVQAYLRTLSYRQSSLIYESISSNAWIISLVVQDSSNIIHEVFKVYMSEEEYPTSKRLH